jgi:putative membrane protein
VINYPLPIEVLLMVPRVLRREELGYRNAHRSQPGADLRDYLAEERTFLAWIRTGVALMTFGFVVARFGLYLAEIHLSRGAAVTSDRFSLWSGTAFIAGGVAMNLFSIRRHLRVVEELNRMQFAERGPSHQAVVLALFLALVGVSMALYLTLA